MIWKKDPLNMATLPSCPVKRCPDPSKESTEVVLVRPMGACHGTPLVNSFLERERTPTILVRSMH